MERRRFVGALLSSSTAAATVARAAAAPAAAPVPGRAPVPAMAVHIAVQHGLPQAAALARDIARELRAQGQACTVQPERQLLDGARIGQLLALERAALVVVADEATAVVVQAMAASRAQACVLAARHRYDDSGSLHSATTPLQPHDRRWREQRWAQAPAAAALHAQALRAAPQGALEAELAHLADANAPAAARAAPGASTALTSLTIRL